MGGHASTMRRAQNGEQGCPETAEAFSFRLLPRHRKENGGSPKQSLQSLALAEGKTLQGEVGKGKAAMWSFFPILLVEAGAEPVAASWTFLCRCRSVPRCPPGWKVGGKLVWSPGRGEQEQWKEGERFGGKVRRSGTSIQVIVVKGRRGKGSSQEAFKPSAQRGKRHNSQGHSEKDVQ